MNKNGTNYTAADHAASVSPFNTPEYWVALARDERAFAAEERKRRTAPVESIVIRESNATLYEARAAAILALAAASGFTGLPAIEVELAPSAPRCSVYPCSSRPKTNEDGRSYCGVHSPTARLDKALARDTARREVRARRAVRLAEQGSRREKDLALAREVRASLKALERAAFALETVAHLQGRERDLLPLAETIRKIAEAAK